MHKKGDKFDHKTHTHIAISTVLAVGETIKFSAEEYYRVMLELALQMPPSIRSPDRCYLRATYHTTSLFTYPQLESDSFAQGSKQAMANMQNFTPCAVSRIIRRNRGVDLDLCCCSARIRVACSLARTPVEPDRWGHSTIFLKGKTQFITSSTKKLLNYCRLMMMMIRCRSRSIFPGQIPNAVGVVGSLMDKMTMSMQCEQDRP